MLPCLALLGSGHQQRGHATQSTTACPLAGSSYTHPPHVYAHGTRRTCCACHALMASTQQPLPLPPLQAMAALQERNEELTAHSEAQLAAQAAQAQEVKAEMETRLAATERKVYALTKERDALRKTGDKLADVNTLLKEKDDIIKQVRGGGRCRV